MPNPRIIARFEGDTYDADAPWVTKKAMRRPKDTVRLAMDAYPDWVVHSEGHVSRNAARTSQKYIRARRGAWEEFEEYNLEVQVFPDFPELFKEQGTLYRSTWNVAVCVQFPLDRGALD